MKTFFLLDMHFLQSMWTGEDIELNTSFNSFSLVSFSLLKRTLSLT